MAAGDAVEEFINIPIVNNLNVDYTPVTKHEQGELHGD
jgi:hypothetical protein